MAKQVGHSRRSTSEQTGGIAVEYTSYLVVLSW
jgi:hypothetical protein